MVRVNSRMKRKHPGGRPLGARNASELERLFRDIKRNFPEMRQKLLEKALRGDVEAIRLCLEALHDYHALKDQQQKVVEKSEA